LSAPSTVDKREVHSGSLNVTVWRANGDHLYGFFTLVFLAAN
jgi:hypothetical protein